MTGKIWVHFCHSLFLYLVRRLILERVGKKSEKNLFSAKNRHIGMCCYTILRKLYRFSEAATTAEYLDWNELLLYFKMHSANSIGQYNDYETLWCRLRDRCFEHSYFCYWTAYQLCSVLWFAEQKTCWVFLFTKKAQKKNVLKFQILSLMFLNFPRNWAF